jgi:hypothetical protein
MNPFDDVRKRLKSHPEMRFEEHEKSIKIFPRDESGFSVSLVQSNQRFTVTYGDGWHEDFRSALEALDCVGLGLSEDCRLKIEMAGRYPYEWTMEYFFNGSWVPASTTGVVLFPYWRRRKTVYRQNHFTPSRGDGSLAK